MPTVRKVQDLLAASLPFACPAWEAALHNGSNGSPLDGTVGNWEPVVSALAAHTPCTIAGMSTAFASVIPSLGTASARATRVKAWRNWCTVLTWRATSHSLDQILPMLRPVLQALLWEFTSLGASNSTLKGVMDSIVARHRDARLPSPTKDTCPIPG